MNIVKLSKTILNMVRAKYIKPLPIIIFILSLSNVVNAADRYWVSAGASNWNNTLNWSASSGGPNGASVPVAGDVAIFDGAGGKNGNCSLDVDFTVSGFQVIGYTGTITQAAMVDMQITSDADFNTGIFIGAGVGDDITIYGNLTISGNSSFTSTAGILELQGNYTFTSSMSFVHNNGTVKTAGDGGTFTGSQTFYDLTLGSAAPYVNNITIGGTFTVINTLTIDAMVGLSGVYYIDGGTIEARGDINFTSDTKKNDVLGTATILINGGGPQTFTGYAPAADDFFYGLPNIDIDKSGGTLTLSDHIATGGNLTHTAGVVSADGTSKLWFIMEGQTITGDITLNEVEFTGFATAIGQITIAASTTVTVTDALTISATAGTFERFLLNTGTIEAQGDINFDSNLRNKDVGTATILINGGGDQTFTGYTTDDFFYGMCKIDINKSTGTLTLIDNIATGADFTHTDGTIDAGTSKLWFLMENQTIFGDITLNDVVFNEFNTGNGRITIEASKTVTVNGTLTINSSTGSNRCEIKGGTIAAKGDSIIHNSTLTRLGDVAGIAKLLINGAGNQIFIGNAPFIADGEKMYYGLPMVEMNKPAGTTLTFKGQINFPQDFIIAIGNMGTIDATTSMPIINYLGGNTFDGSYTVYQARFTAGAPS